jgi:type IV pilus assembly protein PilN
MMIRINLLPVRQVRKREMGRQVLVLFAAVLVLGLVLNYLWYSSRESVRDERASRLTQTRTQIAELEKVIGEVNNINRRKEEVERKLGILTDLRKSRSGPVRMLDALATATPKRVWLRDFDERSNAVKLTGSAMSHEDVADFMRGLASVVWTPKGLGRVVEQKRDAKTARVELLSGEGAIETFGSKEVSPFFSRIDLKRAEQRAAGAGAGLPAGSRLVDFEVNMSANYAI